MNAEEIRDKHILDAFINGLQNTQIRERLFKNTNLNLKTAYEQAYTFEVAQKHSMFYIQTDTVGAAPNTHYSHLPSSSYVHDLPSPSSVTSFSNQKIPDTLNPSELPTTAAVTGHKCYFCGLSQHLWSSCSARDARCHKCGKFGHFSKVSTASFIVATITAASPDCLSRIIMQITVNGIATDALIDTSSSGSYINFRIVKVNQWKIFPMFYSGVYGKCFSIITSDWILPG